MNFKSFFPLPLDASAHGYKIDLLIYLVHVLMLVLFVGWGVYFIVALLKFHRRRHPQANYYGLHSHASTAVEIGVVIVEAVLLIGFSIPFWAQHVNAFPEQDNVVRVRVVAEQFAWNIHYPGPDGVFGQTSIEFFDKATNPLGIDPNDPHGKDDITTVNQLHLPVGRPVIIQLSSKDVVHSFSIPVMRVKQDAVPGMSVPLWFTPTKTGAWEIACAQLCGLGHYYMRGFITVHDEAGYQAWLDEQAAEKEPGGDEEYDDFWS